MATGKRKGSSVRMLKRKRRFPYKEYQFYEKGRFADFQMLKEKFNPQMILERDDTCHIYLDTKGIVCVENKDGGLYYIRYRRTPYLKKAYSLDELSKMRTMKPSTIKTHVVYNDALLYCEF